MDDASFLQALQRDPDNEGIRLAYLNWLEQNSDNRSVYFRLMAERQQVQQKLSEIDSQLAEHGRRIDDDWIDTVFPLRVRSKLVGRFYAKPVPDAPPYVQVGELVAPDTIIGLIEHMKVFSEVTAGLAGIITAVLVETGDSVDYNQMLLKLKRPPRPVPGG
jgi:uncharacterized protein (TIGR02996 family)